MDSETSEYERIVSETVVFVKAQMDQAEGSHDFYHVDRVRKSALNIAKLEGLSGKDLLVVELGALMHDIEDYKYSGSETKCAEVVTAHLKALCVDEAIITDVVNVVSNVSFRKELGGASYESHALFCVQDADRLDAIGAIGVARCFAYGGSQKRALYDPLNAPINKDVALSKEEYTKSETPSVNHFYEKLLKLKDMLKTESGKKLAQKRHEFMESFLDEFFNEWEGKC
eukprot:m.27562 g.27562  ORF g.27562 m.27562 type:complete len:228 (+) comp5955_c1_seq1:116-799(+)